MLMHAEHEVVTGVRGANYLIMVMRELFNSCGDACFVVMQSSMICGSNQKNRECLKKDL